MSININLTYEKLFKACLFSSFLALVSLVVALHFEWGSVQLAKATYILMTYSLFCLVGHSCLWYIVDTFFSHPKSLVTEEQTYFESEASDVLSQVFVVVPILGAFSFSLGFLDILSKRTDGWELFEDSMVLEAFRHVSIENWWLILLLITASAWQFSKELRAVLSNPDQMPRFRERTNVKLMLALIGCIILSFIISAYFNSEDQKPLYVLLMILFFLPWASIFEIMMKIYDDFWKLH